MSNQHLYEDGPSFTWGDSRQIYENYNSEIPQIPWSEFESESESAQFTSYSNMSDQNLGLVDNSYYTENVAGYLVNNISAGYPEADTIFSTDFNTSNHIPPLANNSYQTGNANEYLFDHTYLGYPKYEEEADTTFNTFDQTMQLEDNSPFTGNARLNLPYNSGAAAATSFQKSNETGYVTDFSQSNQDPRFSDDLSFAGGTGDQLPHAAGAKIFDHAARGTMPFPHPEMRAESAVSPQSGHSRQDPPQSGEDYNVEHFNRHQPNAWPGQPPKSRYGTRWSEKDNDNLSAYCAAGLPWGQIARKLGRTIRSCQVQQRQLINMKQEPEEKANEEPEATLWTPSKDVPFLRTKDEDGISRVDWVNPRLRDKREIDWETPGLEDWVHGRQKAICELQNGGPGGQACEIVAAELNKANNTNLNGYDLRTHLPYPGYLQSLRRKREYGQHTGV